MTVDEQLEILQAAKRGEKIEWAFSGSDLTWYRVHDNKSFMFNFGTHAYRIADPYAELKAAAKDPTKQIRFEGGEWSDGDPKYGHKLWVFDGALESYEIRDKPKPKKVVKYLCYDCDGFLQWKLSGWAAPNYWIRRPAFDKECEVEDD
ncbi:MAG: hypothetical protein MUE59_03525 [Thiobacillaceae bacterium]|jgi:hypothetical protein|nr:hypothetical protein [Thiobacillaceae bacterium]